MDRSVTKRGVQESGVLQHNTEDSHHDHERWTSGLEVYTDGGGPGKVNEEYTHKIPPRPFSTVNTNTHLTVPQVSETQGRTKFKERK